MTVYIILWLCTILTAGFCYKYKLKSSYFMWITFIGMTILLGLRGISVGEDTQMYIAIAESAAKLSWKDILANFPTTEWNFISYGFYGGYSEKIETLFMIYNKIIMLLFRSPQMVLVITAIITNLLMMNFIVDNVKSAQDIYMATYIYMCDAFFMNSFNAMRQIFAISIAIQSIKRLKEKKYKQAIIIVLIAACIHQSAILVLVLDFLFVMQNKRSRYKYFLTGVLVFPVVLPVLVKIIGQISYKYASYLQVSFWKSQVQGTMLLWIVIVIGIFIMATSKKTDDYDWWLVYLATLYIGIELIGIRLTMLTRLAMYFRVGLILLFPMATKYFKKNSAYLYKMVIYVLMTMSYFSYASSPARIYSFF